MRRLSMKGKRGKSETSDVESEENGAAAAQAAEDAVSTENGVAGVPKKTPKKGKRGRQNVRQENHDDDNEAETPKKEQQENGSPGKRRKKEEQKASTSENKPDDAEYEVDKVVAQRTIKGRRQFLVRWKGYGEDSDTWEQEKDLNCPELIEEFLSESVENSVAEKSPKTPKRKPEKKTKKTKGKKKETDDDNAAESEEDKPESKEFEVEKILEVHFRKKSKERDFLIRWKGFTAADDTWEPEENLNCPDLITKFMDKVEKAKSTEFHELRTNPAHTKRYTLTTNDSGRRLSRRNMGKQRATYHQCDE